MYKLTNKKNKNETIFCSHLLYPQNALTNKKNFINATIKDNVEILQCSRLDYGMPRDKFENKKV